MESATNTLTHPAVEQLTAIPVFSDLPREELEWLAAQMKAFRLQAGEILFPAGKPAEELMVLFRGEIRAERSDGAVYVIHAGMVTGLLPYSRLTHYPSTGHAVVESEGATLDRSHFGEMLRRMPELNERLIQVMADRIRETTIADQQREKLVSLGKISAGLAHELNNPSAAARRAVDSLRQSLIASRDAALALERRDLPKESRIFLTTMAREWIEQGEAPASLDTLERSEREEELAAWLERRQVANAWELAAALVDAGCKQTTLDDLATRVPQEFLGDALTRMTASLTIARLLQEIESSVGKISELVRAVKEYSYMDQMPEQEIDIHQGIENTLIMLRHRLKHGVDVVREFDRTLPAVCARGSELNQVWTNLIGNAIDAMDEKGKLVIRTWRDGNQAVVEVKDNGPGIPKELQSRIFEPFFTTKAVGEGTGLGLDMVYRIVSNHRGQISFESRAGNTTFTVRIPLSKKG